jgi:hypothetical protein
MGFEISIDREEAYPRYLLDIPFSAGLISLAADRPDDFGHAGEFICCKWPNDIDRLHSSTCSNLKRRIESYRKPRHSSYKPPLAAMAVGSRGSS